MFYIVGVCGMNNCFLTGKIVLVSAYSDFVKYYTQLINQQKIANKIITALTGPEYL